MGPSDASTCSPDQRPHLARIFKGSRRSARAPPRGFFRASQNLNYLHPRSRSPLLSPGSDFFPYQSPLRRETHTYTSCLRFQTQMPKIKQRQDEFMLNRRSAWLYLHNEWVFTRAHWCHRGHVFGLIARSQHTSFKIREKMRRQRRGTCAKRGF